MVFALLSFLRWSGVLERLMPSADETPFSSQQKDSRKTSISLCQQDNLFNLVTAIENHLPFRKMSSYLCNDNKAKLFYHSLMVTDILHVRFPR